MTDETTPAPIEPTTTDVQPVATESSAAASTARAPGAPSPAIRSPIDTLRALQRLATLAVAEAEKNVREARLVADAGTPGADAARKHLAAHHATKARDAFARAEGGINQALQALSHAESHMQQSAEALRGTP